MTEHTFAYAKISKHSVIHIHSLLCIQSKRC